MVNQGSVRCAEAIIATTITSQKKTKKRKKKIKEKKEKCNNENGPLYIEC